jgi:LCP family protein required for cell wall assembly
MNRRSSKRRSGNWLVSFGIAASVAMAGAAGLVRATNTQLSAVRRDVSAQDAVSPPSDAFENYLLVGSDSRQGSDPNDPDYNNVGGAGDVGGKRSDTLMVMHYVKKTGGLSLISIPRDLWVQIGNGSNSQRINTAYQIGTDVLIRTVQRALGIPIHHYIEIDFQGFKGLVDAVGGVTICVENTSRDRHTGLFIKAGCPRLDGVEALAFARSRFFEAKVDGEWVIDGTSDIGRTARQRMFVTALLRSSVQHVEQNPFTAGSVLAGVVSAVLVDGSLNLADFGRKMRPAIRGNIGSFPLPVYGDTVDGNSVLRLAGDAKGVLDFFAGVGPRPQAENDTIPTTTTDHSPQSTG